MVGSSVESRGNSFDIVFLISSSILWQNLLTRGGSRPIVLVILLHAAATFSFICPISFGKRSNTWLGAGGTNFGPKLSIRVSVSFIMSALLFACGGKLIVVKCGCSFALVNPA
jgi:hypothetical protein